MRRSSVVILSIMLVAFGGIMAAGGSALKPLAQDAGSAKVLTRHLQARGDLAEGTEGHLSRLPGTERRLASEGCGLVVQLTPSAEVTRRRGGLRILVLRAAQEGLSRFPGGGLDWVEVGLEVTQPDGRNRRCAPSSTPLRRRGRRSPAPAPGAIGSPPPG